MLIKDAYKFLIFCRLALIDSANNPSSFTLIRLLSGAAFLLIFFLRDHKKESITFSFKTFSAPLMLFFYALFFSLSYVQIDAGTGALVLFACVQLTMILVAFIRGQKLNQQEIVGMALAISGFVYLLLPGIHMPSPIQRRSFFYLFPPLLPLQAQYF